MASSKKEFGRVVLPKEFIESYTVEEGDKIAFGIRENCDNNLQGFLYQIFCADDRPYGVARIVGAEATVDEKNRIYIPAVIRKNQTDEFVVVEEDERYFLYFFKFKSEQ